MRSLSLNSNISFEMIDNIEAYAHHTDMAKSLSQAVDNLPANSAQAIKLYYFNNFSTSEAAEVIGCSVETFRRRLHRAKNQLRDQLYPPENHR